MIAQIWCSGLTWRVGKSDVTKPDYTSALNLAQHFSRFAHFSAGDTIIHEGDIDAQVYFVLAGSVKVTNYSVRGREIWHSELGAGTFFGEMAVLTGSKRSVNIIAQTDTKLAVLTKDELLSLIQHDPSIAIWIMQELARRLEERTDKMSALIAHKIPQRVRAELIRLAKECDDSTVQDPVITPVPNLSEMAVRLNIDRENVSREISALKRIGAIEKLDDRIRILNLEVLESSLEI